MSTWICLCDAPKLLKFPKDICQFERTLLKQMSLLPTPIWALVPVCPLLCNVVSRLRGMWLFYKYENREADVNAIITEMIKWMFSNETIGALYLFRDGFTPRNITVYFNTHAVEVFLAATKQLYKWYFPSVRLSVCPSVRPSVRHTFLTMFPSSYHHETFRSYYQWPT